MILFESDYAEQSAARGAIGLFIEIAMGRRRRSRLVVILGCARELRRSPTHVLVIQAGD